MKQYRKEEHNLADYPEIVTVKVGYDGHEEELSIADARAYGTTLREVAMEWCATGTWEEGEVIELDATAYDADGEIVAQCGTVYVTPERHQAEYEKLYRDGADVRDLERWLREEVDREEEEEEERRRKEEAEAEAEEDEDEEEEAEEEDVA